jgi:hypothetical protein
MFSQSWRAERWRWNNQRYQPNKYIQENFGYQRAVSEGDEHT